MQFAVLDPPQRYYYLLINWLPSTQLATIDIVLRSIEGIIIGFSIQLHLGDLKITTGMTLANIAAAFGKRAPRYGYHRSSTIGTKKKQNGRLYKSKMNGQQMQIGPRGVPPISICVKDMDDNTLLTFGALEDHSAREEILKRHIMDVDGCSYEAACGMFNTISERNMQGYYMVTLPYKIGITSAVFAGVMAFPLVFHLPTIEWFNEWAVTCDIPEARDLETPLEVSIWSWNWMEVSALLSFMTDAVKGVKIQMMQLLIDLM